MYALEVYSLSKIIKKRYILSNVSFKVKKNIIFGIVGPNGSGKTTLLRIITGLYKSNRGFYRVDGVTFNNNLDEILKNISCLIESPKFYDNLSGKENIKLLKLLSGDNIDINKIIKENNLEKYINKKVKNYSLGMKQKLYVSEVISKDSKLIILDEPTNGYDPYEIMKFKEKIKSLKNKTIIICTHDLNLIESLCDEVLFMKNGRIIDILSAPFKNVTDLEKIFLEKQNSGGNKE